MKKRNLFTVIADGFDVLADERTGKQELRMHEVEVQPLADDLVALAYTDLQSGD